MRKKAKESKLNIILTALLVVFGWLLSFSIGVISGKGWSDREYQVRTIEKDTHYQAARADNEPIGDEMTKKEVELLTQRALKEAEAQAPRPQAIEEVAMESSQHATADNSTAVAEPKPMEAETKEAAHDKKAMTAEAPQPERKISSLIPQPKTPKPTAIEYTVQVAAYKTLKEAEIHSEKLIDKGFPAFPVKAMIKGKPWYRVSIGSFKSKKQAMRYEKDLKKQAVVKSTFVQKIKRLKE